MVKRSILLTEGPHDQAAVGRFLLHHDFTRFNGHIENLDLFWEKFIPHYPRKGKLYDRMNFPSVYENREKSQSVAVFQAGGLESSISSMLSHFSNHDPFSKEIFSFGVIADCDKHSPSEVSNRIAKKFKCYFPDFPNDPGLISKASPYCGSFILPDNLSAGVLETVLLYSASKIVPEIHTHACEFLTKVENDGFIWKNFSRDKALVAAICSILRPGRSNTSTILDDDWISEKTITQNVGLVLLQNFLGELLEWT